MSISHSPSRGGGLARRACSVLGRSSSFHGQRHSVRTLYISYPIPQHPDGHVNPHHRSPSFPYDKDAVALPETAHHGDDPRPLPSPIPDDKLAATAASFSNFEDSWPTAISPTLSDVPQLPSSTSFSPSPVEPRKACNNSHGRIDDWSPAKPSIRLLFYYATRRDLVCLVLPATLVAMASGGITPYMTEIVGNAFNAFAQFPLDPTRATAEDKATLRTDIRLACLKLFAIGCGFILLHTVMTYLWVSVGERIVQAVRKEVFSKLGERDMAWFDLGMGAGDGGDAKDDDKEEAVGAAGLMAKFTRETDDIRFATSQNAGKILAYATTFLTCLGIAFARSWALSLVILAAIPVIIICQGVVQAVTLPYLALERKIYAEASNKAERATTLIATVKAFNAQKHEAAEFNELVDRGRQIDIQIGKWWGLQMGTTSLVMNAMFVAGFWFGSKLVREGKLSPGAVMTVFFATVLAASNLQQLVPLLETLNMGMASMASLQTLIHPPPTPSSPAPSRPASSLRLLVTANPTDVQSGSQSSRLSDPLGVASYSPVTPSFPTPAYSMFSRARPFPRLKRSPRANTLRAIRPTKCHGEFVFHNVTFAYPSRPNDPVLRDVTVFLPAGETTFIVGDSGSGKSTIAQLLLQLYQPSAGSITFDDQSLAVLDGAWMKEHVASIQQGCILFDMTVHDNVALGLAGSSTRRPQDVTRGEVMAACRVALINDFVRGLPNGYETMLGTGGASLSGGQRQRVAIARAILRDPTVLILDECTSALDTTTRSLVFEAIKQWRRNKTTIVITHDMSQIFDDDFVYLLKEGIIIEEGFRADLMKRTGGEFAKMAREQSEIPLPETELEDWGRGEELLEAIASAEPEPKLFGFSLHVPGTRLRMSRRPTSITYFDILARYTNASDQDVSIPPSSSSYLNSAFNSSQPELHPLLTRLSSRRRSLSMSAPLARFTNRPRPESFLPLSTFAAPILSQPTLTISTPYDDNEEMLDNEQARGVELDLTNPFGELSAVGDRPCLVENVFMNTNESADLEKQGAMAMHGRTGLLYPGLRARWDTGNGLKDGGGMVSIDISDSAMDKTTTAAAAMAANSSSILRVMVSWFPTVPHKRIFVVGILTSLGHGVITPVWSKYLAELMGLVAAGGTDQSALLRSSAIALVLSIADGLCVGTSFIALEIVAYHWVTNLRQESFRLVLAQDKAWHDQSENSPATIVQSLIKDGDDMLPLVSTIPGHFLTAVTMIAVGIIWALIVGWKLTLVGVAILPVFGGAIGAQFMLLNKIELRNKRMREEVAKIFYETVSNVRAVRAMALESVFVEKFDAALTAAYGTGLQGAVVQGLGSGLMNGMVYFVESLLFYMISVLMIGGEYTYARALTVFSLVVFSLTFASEMLSFLPAVAKAKRAALDFGRYMALAHSSILEASGSLRPTITGAVTFNDVHFAYPTRPDVPVLSGLSFTIRAGECVAIVGASGSGKSTIAALLQRLYEPTSGTIVLSGKHALSQTDTPWLRDHIALVAQSPILFDASVASNIAYGTGSHRDDGGSLLLLPPSEIERACQLANIHDFILSLPKGYATHLGEAASLVSGGQAQRLALARALVKTASVLVLDECTSALDSENERVVLETIARVKAGRTVVMVTHNVRAMRICDRILVLKEGRVVEEGTFEQLIGRGRGGVFADLARGGEWA